MGDIENIQKVLTDYNSTLQSCIEKISDNKFNREGIKNVIWKYAEEKGKGSVLWPMRYALSGRNKSPDPFQLAEVLGKEETISRLKSAIDKIE